MHCDVTGIARCFRVKNDIKFYGNANPLNNKVSNEIIQLFQGG